ncbi:MAG: primosomal protein N' [Clostridiales Family XIII bacterium]|jgi:primosomal protein N' (replication factor Y)|nr:primosomal protein N' [Clostridiales Family XIII bacterium]
MKYVDVAVDTRSDMVDEPFTYACEDDGICVGARIEADFARGKSKRGYVVAVRDVLPAELDGKPIKKILSVDAEHSLPPDAVGIALWMRRRYFCRLIDALACFAPPADPPKRKKAALADGGGGAGEGQGDGGGDGDEMPKFPIMPELTAEQAAAFGQIKSALGSHAAFLVHGVTGSGKTELYMRVASEAISGGRKVIVLVPEISLTPQIVKNFTDRFGRERVAVMHSKLSKGERYAEWARAKNDEADIAIGARGAVFAPFGDIGAIIVDEEHETTYKSDMMPKYDTVEVALKRAARAGAVCVLGSATPSIVSMHRARSGVYRLLKLTERYNKTPLPRLSVVDMRDEMKQGNRGIFSHALHSAMDRELAAGRQAILFLNRRGYSTFISCRACGYVLRCPECGISMTHHKERRRAECHFCGKYLPVPKACPDCGSAHIRHFGIGTEKVEELARAAFPNASVARLDLDSASRKGAAAKILDDFGAGKTDILIGTQMVAKGLDYENVSIVGIVAADVGLNIPDFKSAERTFQLITQAAGRSGRGDEIGEVYVQTYSPGHYAVEAAANADYDGFYRTEDLIRRTLSYPPYSDIYQVTATAKSEGAAARGADAVLAALLGAVGGDERANILGPQKALVYKQGGDFRYSLNIKAMPAKRGAYESALSLIKKKINTDKAAGYRIMVDVNPFSMG